MPGRNQRSRGRSSRSRRKKEGVFLPWLIGVGSLTLILILVGLQWHVRATRVQLDPATMCPLTGPTAVHAMLLDRSDPITPLQAQRVRQVLTLAVTSAPVGQEIELYVLAGNGTQALTPTIALCRPKSEGNALVENTAHIRQAYTERFLQPLNRALDQMMLPNETETSPIMESIKAVCVSAFGDLPTSALTYLTIASDMIQFSPLLNHYRSKDFEAFSQTPGYRETLADCHHATVDVLYLVRPRDVHVQDRRHQLFWERFFDGENAVLMRMEAI